MNQARKIRDLQQLYFDEVKQHERSKSDLHLTTVEKERLEKENALLRRKLGKQVKK